MSNGFKTEETLTLLEKHPHMFPADIKLSTRMLKDMLYSTVRHEIRGVKLVPNTADLLPGNYHFPYFHH